MATVAERTTRESTSEPLMVADWESREFLDPRVDSYLGERLRAVGEDFRRAAILTFCLAATCGLLGWFLLGVLLDHWVIPGGLSRSMRVAWLVTAAAAVTVAAVRWLWPLVRKRVNLVYAARTIERAAPSLRNDLVNAVLVRAKAVATDRSGDPGHAERHETPGEDRRPVGMELVVRSLEKRAAKRLSKMPEDVMADRSQAVRLAAVVAALVGLACLYELLSPKSLVSSFTRIAAPLASIAPPARVRFNDVVLFQRVPPMEQGEAGDVGNRGLERVLPIAEGDGAADPSQGDRRAFAASAGERIVELVRGRQLVVRASIAGLGGDDRAICEVTTLADDGKPKEGESWIVDFRPADPRAGSEGDDITRAKATHEAFLPSPLRGVERPLRFVPMAGDARGEPLVVRPVDPPQILVRGMRLSYPEYTLRPQETVEWQGDIRAVEGTVVSITAEANRPLESAWIDLGSDDQTDVRLDVDKQDDRIARGRLTLMLNRDRTGPWFDSYRLAFIAKGSGQSRQRGLAHRIEVAADLEPEVVVEQPSADDWTVAADLPTAITIRAVDPDFGLTRVVVETRIAGGDQVRPIPLLDGRHQGPFRGTARVVPSAMGARAGATLEYRAVAVDSRQLRDLGPQIVATPWRTLRVADAAAAGDQPRGGDDGSAGGPDGEPEPGGDAPASDIDDPTGGPPPKPNEKPGDAGRRPPASQDEGKRLPERNDTSAEATSDATGSKNRREGDRSARGEQGGMSGKGSDPSAASESGGERPQGGQAGDESEETKGSGDRSSGGDSGRKPSDGSGERSDAGGKSGGKTDQRGSGQRDVDSGERSSSAGERADGASGSTRQQDRNDPAQKSSKGAAPGENRDGPSRNGDSTGNKDSQRQGALASDGTDDGEAVERILDHRRRSGAEDGRSDSQPASRPGERAPEKAADSGSDRNQAADDRGEKGSDPKDGQQQPSGQQDGRPKGESGPSNPKSGDSTCQQCQGRPGGCKNCGGGSGGSPSGSGSQSGGGEQSGGEQGGGKQGGGKQGGGSQEGAQGGGKQGSGEQGGGKPAGGQQGRAQEGGEKNSAGTASGQEGDNEKGSGEQPGGEQGGGKKGGKQGSGDQSGGSQSRSEQGGGEQGAGEQAGGGKEGMKEGGNEKGSGEQAGGEQGGGKQGGGEQDSEDGQASDLPGGAGGKETGAVGRGGWDGGRKGPPPEGGEPNPSSEWSLPATDPARNAFDLALAHLRDSVRSGDDEMLGELGWTRKDAEAFLARWESLARQASSGDPRKEAELAHAVRSLGLGRDGVARRSGGDTGPRGGQHEGRRSRPPSEYGEQFKAYSQGALGQP